jgi:hypothetical protein
MILPDRCGQPLAFSLASSPLRWQQTSTSTPASFRTDRGKRTPDALLCGNDRVPQIRPEIRRPPDAAACAEQQRPVRRRARCHLRKPEIAPKFLAGIDFFLRQHRPPILVLAAREPCERALAEIVLWQMLSTLRGRTRPASFRSLHLIHPCCRRSRQCVCDRAFARLTSVGRAQPRRSNARSKIGSSRRTSTFRQA